MKHAQVSDLKKLLDHYLQLVHRGETVIVLNRTVPVAEVHPVARERGTDRLEVLERKGILRRGTGRLPEQITKQPLRGKRAKLLRALLDEREQDW